MQATIGSWKSLSTVPTLVYDLDAAILASVPVPSSAQLSGSNWLSFTPGVTVGSGAYTVEGWAYFTSANLPGVLLASLTPGNSGFSLVISNSTTINIDQDGVASNSYTVPTMANNTWHHIAVTRNSSGTETVFVDGVRATNGTTSTNYNFSGVSTAVGKFNTGGQWWFTGYCSNIRAVVGSNVYDPTQSTITVPTGPLPVVTNTQFLLQGLADASGTQTITNNGSVALSGTYPFAASTDATGTYALSITNAGSISVSPQQSSGSAQFVKANVTNLSTTVTAPSTDSITYEWWFRSNSVSGENGMLQTRTSTSGGDGIDVSVSDGSIRISTSGAFLLTAGTVVANTWYHIAVVRNGTTAFTVYLNGTSIGTFNKTGLTGTQLYLGIKSAGSAGEAFGGYITDFRYVKGTAVYTAAFTPPEQPPTAISGTDLLLLVNSSDTLLTDSSGNNRTVTNNNSVAYSALNPWPGYFSKTNNVGTDVIYGGPNYVTGQSYTVFMAYQLSSVSAGRLLNTQSEASKDWLMGAYNGNPNTFYPNYAVNLPSTGADTVWHFGWATWNTTTSLGQLYIATNTQPVGAAYSVTNAGGGGFNQLRLFSRSAGSEVQTGNIGFVKVYNGVLDLATIQSQYATYASRFGY
jgi:hypothetical protein